MPPKADKPRTYVTSRGYKPHFLKRQHDALKGNDERSAVDIHVTIESSKHCTVRPKEEFIEIARATKGDW